MKSLSLSRIIFYSLALVVSLPMLLSMFLSTKAYREGFFRQFEASTRASQTTAKRLFRLQGEELLRSASRLADDMDLKQSVVDSTRQQMIRIVSGVVANLELDAVILDKNGNALVRVPEYYNRPHRDDVVTAYFRQEGVAGHDLLRHNRQFVRMALCPIHHRGEIIGWVQLRRNLTESDLAKITEVTGGILLLSSGNTSLSSQGRMVELPQVGGGGHEQSVYTKIGESQFILTVAEIMGYAIPLRLATGLNVDMATAALAKTRKLILFSGLAGIILALFTASSIARRIAVPLEVLVEISRDVGTGGLKGFKELPDCRVREVNLLQSSFRRMYLDLKRGFELITATNLKLDQRLREITILNEINATVAEIQEHEILLSHILALVVKRFDVESASIMIMADGRTLLVKSVFPEAEESDETRYHGWLSWGEGIAGIAIAEKTVIIANSGDKDPRFIPTRQNQSNVNSLMAAPLIVENKGLGVLNLVNHRQGEFNQADRELLESVSHPVAVALSKVILNEVAITDGMTGLYLKRYFDVRLTEEVRRSRRYGNCLSLLFCDIDHFKKVNDTYGHQAGDEVIITFAERIRQSIRLDSDIAGRWGGEEFAVILPQDGAGGAKILAERIRESVKNTPFPTRAGELSITVSIGVATLPMHGTTPDELVHAADKALYVAKESGRDRVVLCSVEDVKKTEITDEQATTEVVGTTS